MKHPVFRKTAALLLALLFLATVGCAGAAPAAEEAPAEESAEAAPDEVEVVSDAPEAEPEEAPEEAVPEEAEEPAKEAFSEEPELLTEEAEESESEDARIPGGKDGGEPVRVRTAAELMEAVAPGAQIVAEEGIYDLTEWVQSLKNPDQWQREHPFVSVEDMYDGPGVVILDVQDLAIRGEGTVEILSRPRYADVLRFDRCSGVVLEALTLGHTPETGFCAGDVLEFNQCSDVQLSELDLYGCGTYGVNGYRCRDLRLEDCAIHDCSYGAVSVVSCRNVTMANSSLVNCEGYDLVSAYRSSLTFEQCLFRGNSEEEELVSRGGQNAVRFIDCSFGEWESASAERIVGNTPGIVFDADCSFTRRLPAPVTAESLDELFEAVAPGAVILLQSGEYDVSAWAQEAWGSDEGRKWNFGHDHVRLEEADDGIAVMICDAEGLTICGGSSGDTVLTADPLNGDVLHFYDCPDLTLWGLGLAHTDKGDEDYYGNCISLSHADGAVFRDLELSGAPGAGLHAWDSQDIAVYDSVLRDNLNCALDMMSCSGLFCFQNCAFTGSEGEGISIFASDEASVSFDGCSFGRNESENVAGLENVETEDCLWDDGGAADWAAFTGRLKLVRFPAEQVFAVAWEGVRLLSPDMGIDCLLPAEEDGIDIRFGLSLEEGGTGVLNWPEGIDVPFRWRAGGAAFMAELVFDRGNDAEIDRGTLWLYEDPEAEDGGTWMELSIDGVYFIWFAPQTDTEDTLTL